MRELGLQGKPPHSAPLPPLPQQEGGLEGVRIDRVQHNKL